MKKIFFWVVGILVFLGVLGSFSSPQTSVQGVQTAIPTATPVPTDTLIPTFTPTSTQKPVYKAPTAIPTSIPSVQTQSSGLSNDNYYTNVDGNEVHSPAYSDSVPDGASAICGDGTYSFSQNRRGTCSHHGGVAQWL
jgi:hypothetical protein